MSTCLTHHFLVAMPKLGDPNFAQTVSYIYEHDDNHALGVVINRPLGLSLRELLGHLDIPTTMDAPIDRPIYAGGPVCQEQGFVLHSPAGEWDASIAIADDVAVTVSRDILRSIATGDGPNRSILALGYAGWGPGQLEREIAENAWLSAPANIDVLFDTPAEHRWQAAAGLLGVDLSLLSADVGHA